MKMESLAWPVLVRLTEAEVVWSNYGQHALICQFSVEESRFYHKFSGYVQVFLLENRSQQKAADH